MGASESDFTFGGTYAQMCGQRFMEMASGLSGVHSVARRGTTNTIVVTFNYSEDRLLCNHDLIGMYDKAEKWIPDA